MAQYDVHIFTVVRVKVSGVEAESQEAAIEAVDAMDLRYHDMFDDNEPHNEPSKPVTCIEWAEEDAYYLVDQQGDTENEKSLYYSHYREPMGPDDDVFAHVDGEPAALPAGPTGASEQG